MLPSKGYKTIYYDYDSKNPKKWNEPKPTKNNPWVKYVYVDEKGQNKFYWSNYLTDSSTFDEPQKYKNEYREYIKHWEAPYHKSFWKGDQICKSRPINNQCPKKGGKNMHNKTKRKNKNKTKRKIHKLKRNITKSKDKRNMKKSKSMRTRR